MGHKLGSKNIWIDGEIHAAFKKKILAEGWTWGMTKKLEALLTGYVKGEIIPTGLQVHHPAKHSEQEDHGEKGKEKPRRIGEPRIGYWKDQLQKLSNNARQ